MQGLEADPVDQEPRDGGVNPVHVARRPDDVVSFGPIRRGWRCGAVRRRGGEGEKFAHGSDEFEALYGRLVGSSTEGRLGGEGEREGGSLEVVVVGAVVPGGRVEEEGVAVVLGEQCDAE